MSELLGVGFAAKLRPVSSLFFILKHWQSGKVDVSVENQLDREGDTCRGVGILLKSQLGHVKL